VRVQSPGAKQRVESLKTLLRDSLRLGLDLRLGPHVHFEKFDPVTGNRVKNIHAPLKDK